LARRRGSQGGCVPWLCHGGSERGGAGDARRNCERARACSLGASTARRLDRDEEVEQDIAERHRDRIMKVSRAGMFAALVAVALTDECGRAQPATSSSRVVHRWPGTKT